MHEDRTEEALAGLATQVDLPQPPEPIRPTRPIAQEYLSMDQMLEIKRG
jgi:hypothetical protein